MSAAVFDDTRCSLGEGPLWHPDRQSLFWFDIDNKAMFEKTISGDRIVFRFDRTVSAAAIVDESSLVVASEIDLFLFDLNDQSQRKLCDLEANNPVTRSNDGRADPFGGFWIGTMGYKAEPKAGAIYRYFRGEFRLLFPEVTISNSICFLPDGSSAFCTDSEKKIVWRVALDTNGWPAGKPVEFLDFRGEDFAPDGAVCDASGNFWSAQWGASRVAVYDVAGELVETHSIPTSNVTCPAFGGDDFSTLFATTSAGHLPDGQHEPLAGFVFRIDGVGRGQAEHRVIV